MIELGLERKEIGRWSTPRFEGLGMAGGVGYMGKRSDHFWTLARAHLSPLWAQKIEILNFELDEKLDDHFYV